MSSLLAKSLSSAIKNIAELDELLEPVSSEPVSSQQDAKLLCMLLKQLPAKSLGKPQSESSIHILAAMFQNVASHNAFAILSKYGIPELCRLYKMLSRNDESDQDEVLFLLKILAMYRSVDGTKLVLKAAQTPYAPDSYLWRVILQNFDENHPHSLEVMKRLRTPLPPDFLGIALLDVANHLAIRGQEFPHPFDSEEGLSRLKNYLASRDENEMSYAVSAAACLPFLKDRTSHDLLALAMEHPCISVQMEGAWAASKMGKARGTKLLRSYCRDARYARKARNYLEELGLSETVPPESLEPDFQALSEMYSWLSHPNEFGDFPDRIELYDTRQLNWPPTNDRRQLWVFKYFYQPQEEDEEPVEEVGVVGSVTFSLFGETTTHLKPLEIYALHCCWELEVHKDPRAPAERSIKAGMEILREANSRHHR